MPVVVVDKPAGLTSFAVVKQIERLLRRRGGRRLRVGHGGTLDPMATGVLPICVGEATKLAAFLLDADKGYEATVRFGVETDTLDADGRVVAERPVEALTPEAVARALAEMTGPQDQVPPMHSALKHEGRRLYALARKGETVERAPRRISVHAFELVRWCPPDRAEVRVVCSKGTYVRVLAGELGARVGTGAHLAALRRTASGPFDLARAAPLDRLRALDEAGERWPWIDLATVLLHLPAVHVSEAQERAIVEGKPLDWTELEAGLGDLAPDARLRLLRRADGSLLAVARRDAEGAVRSDRVFNRDDVPDGRTTGENPAPTAGFG